LGKIGMDANVFLSILLPESTKMDEENAAGSRRLIKSIGLENTGIVSSILMAEIVWAFLREDKGSVECKAVRGVIETVKGLEIINVDNGIAWNAGKLRKKYYSEKLPISYQDAVYLATCIKEGVEVFYTSDAHLLRIKADVPIKEVKYFLR